MRLEKHPEGGLYLTGAFRIRGIGELLEKRDEIRGAAGLWFEHAEVVLSEEVRVAVARVLRLALGGKKVFVMDPLSAEWAAHYQLTGEVGGHPGWFQGGRMFKLSKNRAYSVYDCFYAATHGVPFKIELNADGFTPQDTSNPLVRWATQYGCEAMLAETALCSRSIVDRERARAQETLAAVTIPAASVGAVVRNEVTIMPQMEGVDDATMQALAAAMSGGPRVMEVGSVFDPATHYDANYYGGSEGIRYPGTDGIWKTYHGPGHEWSGNVWVANAVDRLVGSSGTHMDIGCGAGHFVLCMRDRGWESYGVDISTDAAQGQSHVICADFADPAGAVEHGYYDLVTALDFWEHIWERDIDRLLEGAVSLLQPGGLHMAIICTRGAEEKDFVAAPGVTVTPQNAWALVSGHVNIRNFTYWARKFRAAGLRLRYDLMYLFQVLRDESQTMSQVGSWKDKNLLIGEKQ